ncbi:hypothetical protein BDN71DRAFT_1434664 [Pleurotus eryngii]|uniref:Uncharacterized protein n=1 Tax=Pleurotus eryngii TaxID=5323 RepID=A0A9P6DCL3_PLEER|nr:hypothetical protein BDN71DRAFT_1434664 [Pleurotus eryngii]
MTDLYFLHRVADDKCMAIMSMKLSPHPHAFVAVGGVGGWIKVYKADSPFECVAWQGPPVFQSIPCDVATLLWNPTTNTELHAGFSNGDIITYKFHHRGSVSDYETTILERDTEDEMQNGGVHHLALSRDGSIMGAIIHKQVLVIHRALTGGISKMMSIDCNQSTPWRLGFFEHEGSVAMMMAAHDPCDHECGLIVRDNSLEGLYAYLLQTIVLSFYGKPKRGRITCKPPLEETNGLKIYDTSSGNFLTAYTPLLINPEKNFPVDVCFLNNGRFVIGHARARRIFVASLVKSRITAEVLDLEEAGRMEDMKPASDVTSGKDCAEFPGGRIAIVAGEGVQARNGDIAFISSNSSNQAIETLPLPPPPPPPVPWAVPDLADPPALVPPPPPPPPMTPLPLPRNRTHAEIYVDTPQGQGTNNRHVSSRSTLSILREPRILGGAVVIALAYWCGRITSNRQTIMANPVACPMELSVDTSVITETATMTVTKTSLATATITETYSPTIYSPHSDNSGPAYLSMVILIIAPLGGLILHHQHITNLISANMPPWVSVLVGYQSVWGMLDDEGGINVPLVEEPTPPLIPRNLQLELNRDGVF